MALENIAEIESSLGLEAGKLTEMISSEESHTIDLSERVMLSKASYDERLVNIKKESANTALEMAVKEQRNALGLDFQGKTMDNLVTALKSKFEADGKQEPNQKYDSLKTDFEALKGKLVEKETEFASFKTNIEGQNLSAEIKNEFTKHLPDNTLVSKATIFTEAKEKGFSFVKEEGKIVIKDQSGNVLKDSNFSPVEMKDWVTDFSTPYLPKATGGAGEGDDVPKGKAGSFEAFMKESEKNEWNATKQNEEMAKRIKDGTLKM
jgi:hypothetical protein